MKTESNYTTIELKDYINAIPNYGVKYLNSEKKYERIISIGDIHGCSDSIKYHIDNIKPTTKDLVIFLGDYIDRGPDSPGTIDFLLSLKEQVDCFFLRGNHDSMLLSYCKLGGIYGEYFTAGANGGKTTLNQYSISNLEINYSDKNINNNNSLKLLIEKKIPESHIMFLKDTKLFLEMDNFFYSHAGFSTWSFADYDKQTEENYIWSRDEFLGKPHTDKLDKIVVHGHTINYDSFLPSWDIELKKINLDSGSFLSGNISSLTVIPADYSSCYMSVSNVKEKIFENARGAKA